MLFKTLNINKPSNWITDQFEKLRSAPSPSGLKNIRSQAPYFLMRTNKNWLTSVCTALVFTPASEAQTQKIRICFVPNFFILFMLFSWLMSVYLSYQSHQLLLEAHALSPAILMKPFPWANLLPGLAFLMIFLLGPIRSEQRYISATLESQMNG